MTEVITRKYSPGTVLMLETGEYSDFDIIEGFIVLVDMDLTEGIKQHKAEYKPKDRGDSPTQSTFVAWLIVTEKCAPLKYETAHIGSYGDLEVT